MKRKNSQDKDISLLSSIIDIIYSRKKGEDDLIRPILPIEEWVKDPYYVGTDGVNLYKFWVDAMCEIFEGKSTVNMVVLSGGIGCRPVEDCVQTSSGYLNLNEIKSLLNHGEKLNVLTENGIGNISRAHFIGKKSTRIITFNNGYKYEVTSDHLFRVVENGKLSWKCASELRKNSHVLCSCNNSLYPLKKHKYEDFAYLIGHYIEGGNYSKSNGCYRICYNYSNSNKSGYDLCINSLKKLDKNGNIRINEVRVNNFNEEVTVRIIKRIHCYTKNNDILFRENLHERNIPEYVKLFSMSGVCEFVAGLFDSTATVKSNEENLEIQFHIKSKSVAEQLQIILLNLGIINNLYTHKQDGNLIYCIDVNEFYSLEKFINIIPTMDNLKKDIITNFISTKRKNPLCDKFSKSMRINGISNKLKDFCISNKILMKSGLGSNLHESISLGKLKYIKNLLNIEKYHDEELDYLDRNNCYSINVIDVEEGEKECGDIEVEGTHTYINSGIINHNTGKSTCGLFMMVRMLYELSCHKYIHNYLRLKMTSSLIVFLYFSLSKFIAKRTGFKQFREIVDGIPYFKENFPTDPKSKDEVRFPSNVYFLYGTGTGDAIGSNMLCSLLDEANFFSNSSGDSSDFNKVAELHRSLVARQASRFMKNGEDKSLSIVVSSTTFKSSYTEELRKKSLTDPKIKFYRARKWDIEPVGTYSTTNFFYVYCGDDKIDPFIIEEVGDIKSRLGLDISGESIKEVINKLPIEYRTLVDEVPIDFKPQYDMNIVKALQDFSGYSTESTNMLFTNRTVFNSCVDDDVTNIFSKDEFVIETNNNLPSNNISYYMYDNIEFQNKTAPRYIHVDLGLTNDACGIACCYKSGEKEADGIKREIYTYDFSLRIVPPQPPKKISISRVEEFIIYLRDTLHLTIGMVSYDQFQSSASMQRLSELGFNVRLQSVDRTDKAYLFFVENLYLRTVRFNSTFANSIQHELFNLIHYRDKGKVDHPSDTKHGGTKDRMDSIVGAMYNAFECKTPQINFEDTMNLSSYNIEYDTKDGYLKGMNGYDY